MIKTTTLFITSLFIIFSIIFFLNCSTKTIKPGSEKCLTNCQDPDWVHKPKIKDTSQLKAFVGQSFKHSTERMAIEYAENNAREKVLSDFWGSYGNRKLQTVLSNAGASTGKIISDAVVQDIKQEWKASGIVKGDMVEYHVQKWEKYDQTGGVSYYYVAKVLFMVERTLAKQFLTDALENQKNKSGKEADQKNIDRALEVMNKMKTSDFGDW